MRKALLHLPVVAFIAASLSGVSTAQIVGWSYDGFSNGPLANLDGSDGGRGWANAWMEMGLGGTVSLTSHADGLTFGSLAAKPGCADVPFAAYPDMVDYSRQHAAITGGAMYVSFLIRPRFDASNWFTLRLGTYPRQVDVGVPMGSYQYGFMLGDGLFAFTPAPVQMGKTVFLVLEVEHVVSNNSTAYRLYVNPVPGGARPGWPMAEYARAGLLAFGGTVDILGEGGYAIDELRIGSSWNEVTPCGADFNIDGFVNGDDYDAFASAFDAADPIADYNGDGYVNGDDYDGFAGAFDSGC